MKIEIYNKIVFGVPRFYVADPQQNSAILKITGGPTLTDLQMQGLMELGCKLETVVDPSIKIPKLPEREKNETTT